MHGAFVAGCLGTEIGDELRGGYCCFLRDISVTVTVASTFIVRLFSIWAFCW